MDAFESLYLQHLQFDQSLKQGLISRYLANTRVVILIILTLLVTGIGSFLTLPRELNPEVEIPIVSIVTSLPGSSPQDIERLITIKIEDQLENLADVDVISSSSQNSISIITVQFLSTIDPDKAVESVRQQVVLVSDLPTDASDPTIQKLDFNDQPFWQFSLSADIDHLSLTRISDLIVDQLEDIPGVKRVQITGKEIEQIEVNIDPERIKLYHLSPTQIAQQIQSSNLALPSGEIKTDTLVYTVSLDNEIKTLEDLRSVIITSGSTNLPLGQIADVYVKSQDESQLVYLIKNGQRTPAVQISLYKDSNYGLNHVFNSVKPVLDSQLSAYPQLVFTDIINLADQTVDQFNELRSNFLSSIALIFAALTLFLGMRQALIASVSLPLTLFATFIIMGIADVSLNFLSLFSLLLAISLIGDDAIVIVQSSKQYQKRFPPLQAGLLVFRDFFIPIWTGTLTVVWSFVPLLLASGIIGKFIRPIPIVVSATLMSSTAIATFINLPLNIVLTNLHLPKRVQVAIGIITTLFTTWILYHTFTNSVWISALLFFYLLLLLLIYLNRVSLIHTFSQIHLQLPSNPALKQAYFFLKERSFLMEPLLNLDPITLRYKRFIDSVILHPIRRRLIYLLVTVMFITGVVFAATGLLKNEFFPKTDENLLFVNIEAPAGWQLEKTELAVNTAQPIIASIPEVVDATLTLGSQISLDFGTGGSGDNYAHFALNLIPKDHRVRTSTQIAEDLRNQLSPLPDAKFTVVELSGGPPAGADFQANIKGENLETLETIAADFSQILSQIPGTTNITTSLKLTPGEIKVNLKAKELARRGITAGEVAAFLRNALSGSETGELIVNQDEQKIIVSLDSASQTISHLQNLNLPGLTGTYTLAEIADFTLTQSPTSIAREDGNRVVRVFAGVTPPKTAPELLKEFQAQTQNYQLPSGYTWDVGGANEENQESINSIIRAMSLSFTLIMVTMVLLLNSFRQATIVLLTIPIAMTAVFVNFTIFRIPLSFPALIGILALFGIVVNNAIMLMDKINQNRNEHFPLREGIADACASRVEPIFLTAFTGILGLLPVTISDPLWQGLGGAIIAGLSVSGFITLFIVPSLYFDIYQHEHRIPQTGS